MLVIKPVTKYDAPKIPTLDETRENPALLENLPHRWKKNAAVIACIGFAGVLTLSGCGLQHRGDVPLPTANPYYRPFVYTQVVEQELVFRIHGGGGGSSDYVAHLTEQEALGIIRLRLEEAGLRFDANPPGYVSPTNPGRWFLTGDEMTFEIDLFDAVKGVAVTNISWAESTRAWGGPWRGELADIVANEFSSQNSDIAFGVFYNPGRFLGAAWDWDDEENLASPSDEEIEASRPILVERLNAQVDAFIEFLKDEGILQ